MVFLLDAFEIDAKNENSINSLFPKDSNIITVFDHKKIIGEYNLKIS